MTPARIVALGLVGALLVWALRALDRPFVPAEPADQAVASSPAARAAPNAARPSPDPIVEPQIATSEGQGIRVERLEKIERPPGPLVDAYDALALRANAGDAEAALQLGLGLYHCHRAPRSETELRASIDRIRSSPPRVYYFGSERREITHAERIDSLQQGFDYCAGIPRNVVNGYFDWLVLGAELGLPQAKLAAALTPHPDGFGPVPTDEAGIARMNELRATAMHWTHEAVADGSIAGMQWLAMRYHKGVLVEQDWVQAYAYMSAAAQARAAAGEATDGDSRYLDMLARQLNTAQRNEAERLADDYLADPACCKL